MAEVVKKFLTMSLPFIRKCLVYDGLMLSGSGSSNWIYEFNLWLFDPYLKSGLVSSTSDSSLFSRAEISSTLGKSQNWAHGEHILVQYEITITCSMRPKKRKTCRHYTKLRRSYILIFKYYFELKIEFKFQHLYAGPTTIL